MSMFNKQQSWDLLHQQDAIFYYINDAIRLFGQPDQAIAAGSSLYNVAATWFPKDALANGTFSKGTAGL